MTSAEKQIVVIGGGFAGVNTARYLQGKLPAGWKILLFSQENHIVFTPLLGDVVGASINPMHVVWPVRQMLRGVDCRTAAVTQIDLAAQEIVYEVSTTKSARQRFDHLVVAAGSAINFNIIPGMAAHGWPLKSIGDALALRNHLIGLLERADVEPNPEIQARLLSIVVVGGGFSGVEVAGELYDLLHDSCRYYTHIQQSQLRVTVLEARERILPELPESLSAFALAKMQKRGIEIRVGAQASAATDRGVLLKDGTQIDAATVICTIGITAHPLVMTSGLPLERNRIQVTGEMRVKGFDNVWALGDCAVIPNAHDNQLSPPTAQFATRQAKQLARNLARVAKGQPPEPFSFKPLGMLASIGNRRAVGIVFGVKLSGLLAWLLWRGVYLSKMPTFTRKVQIAFDWLWQLLFPRDIVQLNMQPTERFGQAHFEAGQFVFHRGDPADKFYVIQRGHATVHLEENGPSLNKLSPGDHFGEAALLGAAPRSASIRADGPLDVLTMSRTSFNQLTGGFQVLRTALAQSFERRQSAQRFLELAQDHPRLRECRVAEVAAKEVVCLPEGLTWPEALVRARDAGGPEAYPVVDQDERLVGICARADLYRAAMQLLPEHTPLREIMQRPATTVRQSDSLADALVALLREQTEWTVVVDDHDASRAVGLLTPLAIVAFLTEDLPGCWQQWSQYAPAQPS